MPPAVGIQNGEGPLHIAAALSAIRMGTKLLEQYHLNPDEINYKRTTPLHIACNRKDLDFARLLIKYNANVNKGYAE